MWREEMFNRKVLGLAVAATIFSSNSAAQEFALEEIIVTAQKRAESLQDVPISVSAMDGDTLSDAAIPDIESFSTYVPNFTVSTSGYGEVISIRGIQSGAVTSIEQSVATFVDGVYRGRGAQSRFGLFDVGMVEVLRGPQGTLFGKNTIGGALNVTSAAPTDEFEGQISALHEVKHEETEVKAYVSGPLSDSVRGRLALLNRDRNDGWVDNTYYGDSGPVKDEWAARGSLEWDPSEDVNVSFKYEHGDWDNRGNALDEYIVGSSLSGAYAALGLNGDVTPGNKKNSYGNNSEGINFGDSSIDSGDSDEVSLRVDYDLQGGTLTSIYSYSAYERDFLQDVDLNAVDGLGQNETEDYEQNALELRFVSDLGEGFEYIAGVYFQKSKYNSEIIGNFNVDVADPEGDSLAPLVIQSLVAEGVAPDIPTAVTMTDSIGQFTRFLSLDQKTETWAAFGQATWDLSETLSLTVGARYGEEEKEASQGAHCASWNSSEINDLAVNCNSLSLALAEFTPHQFDDLDIKDENWTYSLNMQWDLSSSIMAYATISTGVKSGGFNNFSLSDSNNEAEFGQEEVKSYELGAKMTLLDGEAELNIALFDMDYDELQAAVFTGTTGFKVENAASASIRGLELDGRWKLSQNWLLRGSAGYVDFEFDEYPNAGCTDAQKQSLGFTGFFTSPPTGTTVGNATAVGVNAVGTAATCEQDLKGGTNAFTPEWTASISIEHQVDIGDHLYLRTILDGNYMGDHFTAPDNDPLTEQSAYTLWNLSMILASQDERWDVSFIARNITDESYINYSVDMPLFAGTQVATWGREESYAIRGRINF